MIPSKKIVALFALTLSFTAASSRGDTYDYSYTFGSGNVVSGSFDGTAFNGGADGPAVTDLTDLTISYDGFPGSNATLVEGFLAIDVSYIPFSISDQVEPFQIAGLAGNLIVDGNDGFVAGSFFDPSLDQTNIEFDAPYQPGNWTVTDASVPDSGATITMVGMAIVGLAGFHRRKVARP
jgi:hypothetical protein